SLGATRIDIGQGDVGWVVMADPDGNEFCVLSPDSGPRTRALTAAALGQVMTRTSRTTARGALDDAGSEARACAAAFQISRASQAFLSVFGPIHSHFRPRRHRLSASRYRDTRTGRFATCRQLV